MDQERQIRFVIPPFLLFGSLLWGAFLAGKDLSPILKPAAAKEILGLLAATAVALIPIGFVIGILSINLIRLVFWRCGKPTYEAILDEPTLSAIWQHLGLPGIADASKTLYVAATYDHECLSQGVHLWIFRRWTSLNLAMHSLVAILLSHAVAPIFQIPETLAWAVGSFGLVALFVATGMTAWSEVMEMVRFQALRKTVVPPSPAKQTA